MHKIVNLVKKEIFLQVRRKNTRILPGKRLDISVLYTDYKRFRDHGYKKGALAAFHELEKKGLGVLETNKSKQGKVSSLLNPTTYLSTINTFAFLYRRLHKFLPQDSQICKTTLSIVRQCNLWKIQLWTKMPLGRSRKFGRRRRRPSG